MAQPTITNRDFLAEIERIRREIPATRPFGQTTPDFLDHIVGIFNDDPLFEAAERAGKEWRYADRPCLPDLPCQ